MKAIVVYQYGGPEVLKFEEYPDPVPGAGEVLRLVEVRFSTVTPRPVAKCITTNNGGKNRGFDLTCSVLPQLEMEKAFVR